MASVQPRTAALLGCVVLALGIFGIFGKVGTFHGAILDDGRNLLLNPRVGSLSARDLAWALIPHADYAPRYIPLGWWMADVETSLLGYDPAPLREVNLLFHLANTLLLMLLLRRILLRAGIADSVRTVAAACLGAAAYGFHPLRTEMVGWASTVFWQEGIFWLLLAGFARTSAKPRPALEALLYAASLLAYPAALGLAPGLVIFDALRSDWKSALRRNAGLLAVATADGIVTFVLASAGSPGTTASFPPLERLLQVLAVEGRGIGLWICPTHLTPYAKPLERFKALSCVELSGAAVLTVAGLSGLCVRRLRPLLAWVLLFAAAVLPFTWVTSWQDPDVPDRYYVLSSLVLCTALAWGAARRPGFWGTLGAIGVLGWSVTARQDVPVWRDETSLFTRAIDELDRNQPDYREHRAFFEFHLAIERYNAGDYAHAKTMLAATMADDPGNEPYARAEGPIDERARLESTLPGSQLALLPSVPVVQHRDLAMEAVSEGEDLKSEHHLQEIRRMNPTYCATLTAPRAGRLPP